MDLEKIEGLVKIIENSSLKQFTYKDGEVKITLSKLDNPPALQSHFQSLSALQYGYTLPLLHLYERVP